MDQGDTIMKTTSLTLAVLVVFCSCAGAFRPDSDSGSGQSRTIRTTGAVRLTGSGGITIPGLAHPPEGMSVGLDGSLYLCDTPNARVLKVDPFGRILTAFNEFDSRAEGVFIPADVSVSGGIEVYVLDSGRSRVLRLDRNLRGAYTVYAPDSSQDRLFGAFGGIAFDPATGDIFVTDRDNGTIIRIDMLGGNIQTTGAFGSGRASLSAPAGIDVTPDGSLLIADEGGTVAIERHFGAEFTLIGRGVLESPFDVAAIDGGSFAVADRRGIVVFDSTGSALAAAGFDGDEPLAPRAIAYSDGILYVSDAASSTIRTYTLTRP